MGCDIHIYVEKRQEDGLWAVVAGPNPRISNYRRWAAYARERGEIERAEKLEQDATEIASGRRAKEADPDEDGFVDEYDNPMVLADWAYDGRNYDLFAILANVRNGRGFAGIKTGAGFVPVAMPKGLPDDVSHYVKARSDSWGVDGHSHSHHTLADLLAYDWRQTTSEYGVVGESGYRIFKEKGAPESWNDGVNGSAVRQLSVADMDRLLAGDLPRQEGINYYTAIQWMVTYQDAAGSFFTDTIPKLQALAGDDHNSVRIVFWFDN